MKKQAITGKIITAFGKEKWLIEYTIDKSGHAKAKMYPLENRPQHQGKAI